MSQSRGLRNFLTVHLYHQGLGECVFASRHPGLKELQLHEAVGRQTVIHHLPVVMAMVRSQKTKGQP
jgi:hypothetical protein